MNEKKRRSTSFCHFRSWWRTFEDANKGALTPVLGALEELASRKLKIHDLFDALEVSGVQPLRDCFDFLSYCQSSLGKVDRESLLVAHKDYSRVSAAPPAAQLSEPEIRLPWRHFLNGHSCKIYENCIELIGMPDYIERIRLALDLIKSKDTEAHAIILNNLGQIREWYQSGVTVYGVPPIYYMSRKGVFPSITWCASCIAHEAHHVVQYRTFQRNNPGSFVPPDIYHGQEAEMECNKFQLRVARKIKMPPRELQYLESCDGSHWNLPWGDMERFY